MDKIQGWAAIEETTSVCRIFSSIKLEDSLEGRPTRLQWSFDADWCCTLRPPSPNWQETKLNSTKFISHQKDCRRIGSELLNLFSLLLKPEGMLAGAPWLNTIFGPTTARRRNFSNKKWRKKFINRRFVQPVRFLINWESVPYNQDARFSRTLQISLD